MAEPAGKKATYEDLYCISGNRVGEIIHGRQHSLPRPSPRHAKVSSDLGAILVNAYRFGNGASGGMAFAE